MIYSFILHYVFYVIYDKSGMAPKFLRDTFIKINENWNVSKFKTINHPIPNDQ